MDARQSGAGARRASLARLNESAPQPISPFPEARRPEKIFRGGDFTLELKHDHLFWMD